MSKICQITGKKAMIQRFTLKKKNEKNVRCELVYKKILLCRTRLLD